MRNVSGQTCRCTLAVCLVWIFVGCGDEATSAHETRTSDESAEWTAEAHDAARSAPSESARLDDGQVLTLSEGLDVAVVDADVDARVSTLKPVESCREAEPLLKREALDHMNAHFDAVERATRERSAKVPDRCLTVTYSTREPSLTQRKPKSNSRPTNMLTWMRPGPIMPTQTSSTNNQVAGVDEADFIKNDDKYVYAALNGAFRIIEAWPATSAHEVANIKLEGEPKKLVVQGDRALLYMARPRAETPSSGPHAASPKECTYAYDCEFRGDGTDTTILIYDISDRSAPKELRRIDVNGSLLAARRIGDAVHTVLVTPELFFPGVWYPAVGPGACENDSAAASFDAVLKDLAARRAANIQLIEQTSIEDLLLEIREDGRDHTGAICKGLHAETIQTGSSRTSILSLSLSNDSALAVSTIVSKPGAVYASESSLYLAVNQKPEFSTTIHKFRLDAELERAVYVASGRVEGSVLNQFSLDEHKEHLRVATSIGRVPSPEVHSALSVLQQRGAELEMTGKVDDIAPGEDIRSVRFDRDRGFIVTFKKTDPLYAFDLSDPTRPAITGELKIPGFSTYMHMLDDTHLLTIGYDAADQNDFAFFTGVLVQLFDVSDMTAPTLEHKVVIGTRGSSSQALNDHLAFTLFGDKLALPMTICDDGNEQGHRRVSFGGLMLFDVSVERGISERGRVGHPGPDGTFDADMCSTWWTSANSAVKRSVFMDDFVYSIATDVMRVQNLDALGKDVASVMLATDPAAR